MTFNKAPLIEQTFMYNKFKFLKFNRDINKSNFSKLLKLSKSNFQLHNFPIVVDGEFNIIDGQHRYLVSKEMNAPVYYIIDKSECSNVEHVNSLNIAGRKHTLLDKINMHFKDGHKLANALLTLYDQYEYKIAITTICECCMMSSSKAKYLIERDEYIFNDRGIELLSFLASFDQRFMHSNRVARAFISIMNQNNDIPLDKFFERIRKNFAIFGEPKDTYSAKLAIIKSYNHSMRNGYKIKSFI